MSNPVSLKQTPYATDHGLLLLRHRSETPLARVRVAVHDAPLDLGHNTVVASRQLDSGHLCDTDGNSLALGRHQNNLLVELNVGL